MKAYPWILAMLLGANTSFAQLGDNEDGFYVGAGLGNYEAEIDDVDDADFDFDEDESALRLFAGWRFNQFISMQLDRYDFSEAATAPGLLNVTADTEGWAPSVIGTLPLGPIELYARAGILFYDVEIGINNETVFDDSGDDPVYAAGLGLTVVERLALRFEYEVIEISEFDDSEAVWVTVGWRF
jgi:OOP family OmpA-OmpF porin